MEEEGQKREGGGGGRGRGGEKHCLLIPSV